VRVSRRHFWSSVGSFPIPNDSSEDVGGTVVSDRDLTVHAALHVAGVRSCRSDLLLRIGDGLSECVGFTRLTDQPQDGLRTARCDELHVSVGPFFTLAGQSNVRAVPAAFVCRVGEFF
jgi:hypothetical protein